MPDRLFDNPDVYVEKLDMSSRRAVTWPMTRDAYAASIFLDHRIQAAGPASDTLSFEALAAAWREEAPEPRPMRVIFHTALCGSTLLSRCLDRPGKCLSLREPFLLHQWAFMRRLNPAAEETFTRPTLAELCCALMSRSYSGAEVVLVKPTDSCVNIAESLLGYAPGSRGLLLYQSLERFLLAMLRDGARRRYVRAMVDRAHTDLLALGRMTDIETGRLSDAEAAAYVWMGVIHWYRYLLASFPEQYRSLDARDFFENPEHALRAVQRWFRLPFETDEARRILAGGVMDRHSKHPGVPFDRGAYEELVGEAEHGLRADIDAGMRWAEDKGEGCDLAGPLDRDLISEADRE